MGSDLRREAGPRSMRRIPPHTAPAVDGDAAQRAVEPQLSLSAHVFFCKTDTFCVFLDLKQDRYLCVRRDDIERLGSRLYGWSSDSSTAGHRAAEEGLEDLARPLLDARLLTLQAGLRKPVCAPRVTRARRALSEAPRRRPWPFLNLRSSARTLCAALDAHRQLTSGQLERTIERARYRKQTGYADRSFDAAFIRARTTHFSEIRGYFPRSYLCLFDSLALVNYLASYRIFPDWVFGVRTDPFEAHCWVQHDDTVLNDTLDRINTFTPIMVI